MNMPPNLPRNRFAYFKRYGVFFMVLFLFALTASIEANSAEIDHCYSTGTHQLSASPSFNGSTQFYSGFGPTLTLSKAGALGRTDPIKKAAHETLAQALAYDFKAHKDFDIEGAFDLAMALNRAVYIYGLDALSLEDRKSYRALLKKLPAAYAHLRQYNYIRYWDRYGGYTGRMAAIAQAVLNLEVAELAGEKAKKETASDPARLENDTVFLKMKTMALGYRQRVGDGTLTPSASAKLQNHLDHTKAIYLRGRNAPESARIFRTVSSFYEQQCDRELRAHTLIDATQVLLNDVAARREDMTQKQWQNFEFEMKAWLYRLDLLPNTALIKNRALSKRMLKTRLLYHGLMLAGAEELSHSDQDKANRKNNNTCALGYFMDSGQRLGFDLELPKGTVIDPAFAQKCYDPPL